MLFYLLFLSTSPRSSSTLDGRCINEDKTLEWLGRLEQPIAVSRPDEVSLERVGFWVSRDLISVSCVPRS